MIVLAHGGPTIQSAAAALLRADGHSVLSLADGASVRSWLAMGHEAHMVILGAALVAPPFFELCSEIRAAGRREPILLITSNHSPRAYKREPTNLYGADDYVEEAKLASELVAKVHALSAKGRE